MTRGLDRLLVVIFSLLFANFLFIIVAWDPSAELTQLHHSGDMAPKGLGYLLYLDDGDGITLPHSRHSSYDGEDIGFLVVAMQKH